MTLEPSVFYRLPKLPNRSAQHREHLFLGKRSCKTAGCEFERTLQGVETADQGDAGDGGGISFAGC